MGDDEGTGFDMNNCRKFVNKNIVEKLLETTDESIGRKICEWTTTNQN